MSDPKRGRMPSNEHGLELQPFLEARRLRPSANIEELKQASDTSGREVIATLGTTAAGEAWITASSNLELAFIDEANGVLGKRLLQLEAMDDETFATHREEAEAIVRQTAVSASRLYPLIHRLQLLDFAPTREAVVKKLSRGDLVAQTKVDDVSVTPIRETLIGTLRAVDARVGTNLWSLEYAPEIPASVVVTDPFDATSKEIADLWSDRMLAKGLMVQDREHTIRAISGDITGRLAGELEQMHERAEDATVREAAQVVVAFLNRKALYYQDPDPRDFELYHLGMEQPDDLMNLFRALDTIKHADPELFLEMVGINPEDGGRSPLFGSFLHKALYNTQRTLHRAQPELGEMALGNMMQQLLTMDAEVQTYAGVVSQESLKAMAGEMRKAVDAQPDAASKAQQLLMMAGSYMTMAIDAEVRRQLEVLREVSPEQTHADLKRHLEDLDHPLKALDYIASMPKVAFADIGAQKEFQRLFGISSAAFTDYGIDQLQQRCRERHEIVLYPLYDRIPLLDDAQPDLGMNRLQKVLVQDALAREGFLVRVGFFTAWDPGAPMPGGILDYLRKRELPLKVLDAYRNSTFLHRRYIDSFRWADVPSGHSTDLDSSLPRTRRDDRSVLVGESFVELFHRGEGTRDEIIGKIKGIMETIDVAPDLVFLSMLAQGGKGARAAFKMFDTFCDVIPSERLVELFTKDHLDIQGLRAMFSAANPPQIFKGLERPWRYAQFLRGKITDVVANEVTHEISNEQKMEYLHKGDMYPQIIFSSYRGSEEQIRSQHSRWLVQVLRELHDVIETGKTPWTYSVGENAIDLWDIWQKSGANPVLRPDKLMIEDSGDRSDVSDIKSVLSTGPTKGTLEYGLLNGVPECALVLESRRPDKTIRRESIHFSIKS